MLFDLRGRGRRRTVKIVYITLAAAHGRRSRAVRDRRRRGDAGRPRGRHHRLVAAVTPAPSASTRPSAGRGGHAEQPAGRRRMGRAGPRPRPERGHRRQLRPEHGDVHRGRQGEARGRVRRVGEVPRARPEEPRRPRRRADGARVRPDRPQPPGRRRSGAGDHHRGPAVRDDLRHAGDLRLPGRPDPQGRPRTQRGPRPRPRGREEHAQELSSTRPSSRRLAQQLQQGQGSETPTPTATPKKPK